MTSTSSHAYVPWFSRRPGLALTGVLAMFVAVTVLRLALGDDATVAITLLYVVPISLVALAWGRLPGAVASGVALTLLTLWVLIAGVDLTPLGWAARAVPLLLVGLVLGDASDRLRRAEQARVEQAERELLHRQAVEINDSLLHRQAVEINDSLLQSMAAAKWALEAGRSDVGLERLSDAMASGQELVSQLIRDSRMGPLDISANGRPR